jgi:aspartyl protease family protein
MRHIEVEVVLSNIQQTKSIKINALVDTGATLSVIPEEISKELNLSKTGEKVKVLTVKGIEELELAHASIEIMGKKRIMPVLISKQIDKVLIGVTTLEAMNLKVNPKTQQLEEFTAFLY